MLKGEVKSFLEKLSIRGKLIMFMLTILLVICTIDFYFYTKTYNSTEQYNNLLKDFIQVNDLSLQISNSTDHISIYVSSSDTTELDKYYANKKQVEALSDKILQNSGTLNTYLLSKSIKNTIPAYIDSINETIRLKQSKGDYYPAFLKSKNISLYLVDYVKKLLYLKLTEGQWYHQQITSQVNAIRIINLSSLIGIMIFSLIYVIFISKSITTPINVLTRFAMHIANGDLNTNELKIKSSPDINILVSAFNKMASSIQKTITLERKVHEDELNRVTIFNQLNEAKFLALQSQINPHFLFNTLNTIMRIAMFEKANKTVTLIQNLSNIFRHNLENSNKEVFLCDELSIIEEYISIQKVRFGSRVDFSIICKDNINDILIPRFILQPLVENSIVHGLEPKEFGGKIKIKIYKRNELIIIKIIDNGVGISKDKLMKILEDSNEELAYRSHTEGIGVKNVISRLKLFYNDPSCFKIMSKTGLGTVITIKIKARRCS
jgi:two-component system, sensor histidine kinase YesM